MYYLLKKHVTTHLKGLANAAAGLGDEALLKYYATQWALYLNSSKLIDSLFQYLNRMWIKRSIEENITDVCDINTVLDSNQTCLLLWNEHFFTPLHNQLLPALLSLIYKDRKGETINRGLIQEITGSFVIFGIDKSNTKAASLDVYQEFFEKPFIQATESFYKGESETFISNNPVTEYMKKVFFALTVGGKLA